MNTARVTRSPRIAGLLTLTLAGLALTGCIYANLPGTVTNQHATSDPNQFPAPKLMALSLEYVANRYPPAAGTSADAPTFAFNLPAGVNNRSNEIVASMLGNRGVPVTPENASQLPIYHISTMWIRGSRAQVEMVYPVEAIGMSPSNQPVYRGVSLQLGSDIGPWRVMRQQLWNVGTIPVPDLHYPNAAAVATPIAEPAPAPASEQSTSPGQPVHIEVQPATPETVPAGSEGNAEPESAPK